MPLIQQLACEAKQIWFADDATRGGKLRQLKGWWDKLNEIGPVYGYFPNSCKTWLLVKENQLEFAQDLFSKTGVQITTEGRRLLGAPIGTANFCSNFVEKAVSTWKNQLELLSSVARVQPHAAFSAFSQCLIGKWTFFARTAENTISQFQRLEDIIRGMFIPQLTGRSPPGDDVRELLALPPCQGGLGLINPSMALAQEFKHSQKPACL